MLISVVIACYNEEDVLEATHARLMTALRRLEPTEFELVYVNDGSRDSTLAILSRLQDQTPQVRVVGLARNFGHQMAVTAGIEHSRGDAVVIIDADLQDPPEVIADMVERWQEGYDVVYGLRTDREGESQFKLWTAKLFYRMIAGMSDTPIPLDTGDFRLMDRRVVEALLSMPERDRFIRGMVSWIGFRQIGVPYRREPRFAGETKYPLKRMLRFAIDGITSFSTTPLRLTTWFGFSLSALACVGILRALYVRLFTDTAVPGWAGTFIAILFFAGVQLLALGVMGEYIGRIYHEVKRRPLYVVAQRMGFANPDASVSQPLRVRASQSLRREQLSTYREAASL